MRKAVLLKATPRPSVGGMSRLSLPDVVGDEAEDEEAAEDLLPSEDPPGSPPAHARQFAQQVRDKLQAQYEERRREIGGRTPSPSKGNNSANANANAQENTAITTAPDESPRVRLPEASAQQQHRLLPVLSEEGSGLDAELAVAVATLLPPDDEGVEGVGTLEQQTEQEATAAVWEASLPAADLMSISLNAAMPPQPPSALAPFVNRPVTVSVSSRRVVRVFPDSRLSEPSMRLIGSQGIVRPRRAGSPPKRLARTHGVEDAATDSALTPLQAGMSDAPPRALLFTSVARSAQQLQEQLEAKAQAKATAPQPKHTNMILYAPAALRVTQKKKHKQSEEDGTEEEEKSLVVLSPSELLRAPLGEHILAQREVHRGEGGGGGELVVGANQARLDVLASIPPPPVMHAGMGTKGPLASPRSKKLAIPLQSAALRANSDSSHSASSPSPPPPPPPVSGTSAAVSGLLASRMSPLSTSLQSSGLSSTLTTGLVAVSQMLPSSSNARRMAELYAAFQRHLTKSAEYFQAEASRGKKGQARFIMQQFETDKEGRPTQAGREANEVAANAADRALSSSGTAILHRVDSEGFIIGPDRVALSLAPDAADLILVPVPTQLLLTEDKSKRGAAKCAAVRENLDAITLVPAATLRGGVHERDSTGVPISSLSSHASNYAGMLDGQSCLEIAHSISVLSSMLSHDDALDNEQALRVLSAFDRQKGGLVLPPALMKRAKELQEEMQKRDREKTKQKEENVRKHAQTAGVLSCELARRHRSLRDGRRTRRTKPSRSSGRRGALVPIRSIRPCPLSGSHWRSRDCRW